MLFTMLIMRFFTFITLTGALLLFISNPFAQKLRVPRKNLPAFILDQQNSFKESFTHPRNANLAWAMMTGEKIGLSPKDILDFTALELNFLFSPSGLHLTAFMTLIFFIFNQFKWKKFTKILQWLFLAGGLFFPILAIKRLIILRLLILGQRFFKIKCPIEVLFLITFVIAYLLGHYTDSPLGFILSYLFIGTFISLAKQPRIVLVLGLFSTHLLIAFFSGNQISFFSILFSIPLIALFSFVLPFFYLYFLTFKWMTFNWIEWAVRAFVLIVHWMAKIVQGSHMSSTFFLIMALWIVLLRKEKKYLLIVLLLHGNAVLAPTLFYSRSYYVKQ